MGYVHALNRKTGPTALILSRQGLPILPGSAADKRAGSMKGAYTVVKETSDLTNIILAAGSEVSIPCMELFEEQDNAYRMEVLSDKTKTIAVEAGVSSMWYKYADKVLGVDSFGESAPAHFIFEAKGITVDNLVKTAKA